MIFFTSDLHFGHEHIIQFNHRPFRNVTEMNRQLISNYNAVVQPEDTVYLLGDLSFQISVEKANALIAQLNGKKHLILGNHDKSYAPELFEEILIYRDLRVGADALPASGVEKGTPWGDPPARAHSFQRAGQQPVQLAERNSPL